MGCLNCTGAITQQKANDEKIINIAKQKAKDENRTIALYRNEQGELAIATDAGNPIVRYITPLMQNT